MTKENGKPQIRFAKFKDTWEQRKLDDWGDFYYGRSCPKWSVTEDATIPCIRYGELYTKFGAKIDRVYSYTNIPPEKLRFSKGTEVLIPRVGEDPMDYNHCTWLSMPDIAIGEMISVFNTDNNPLFTATMFNATLQNEFAMRVEGGSVTNLYFEKLKNIEVSFPSIPEQEKIAAYFADLDHLITLHQRKYDKLTKVKKSMLEKMFPKNGTNVPEIRFKGFTDAWEQRKVKDLCSISTGKSNTQDKDEDGEYPFFVRSPIIERSTKYLYDEEAVITVGDGVGTGKVFHYVNGKYDLHQRCYRMYDFTSELNAHYFYHVFSKLFHNRVMAMTAKTSVDSVRLEMIADMEIPLPNIDEQREIGAYLDNLDNLITLHQRKLEKLKILKKACLEKMFV